MVETLVVYTNILEARITELVQLPPFIALAYVTTILNDGKGVIYVVILIEGWRTNLWSLITNIYATSIK